MSQINANSIEFGIRINWDQEVPIIQERSAILKEWLGTHIQIEISKSVNYSQINEILNFLPLDVEISLYISDEYLQDTSDLDLPVNIDALLKSLQVKVRYILLSSALLSKRYDLLDDLARLATLGEVNKVFIVYENQADTTSLFSSEQLLYLLKKLNNWWMKASLNINDLSSQNQINDTLLLLRPYLCMATIKQGTLSTVIFQELLENTLLALYHLPFKETPLVFCDTSSRHLAHSISQFYKIVRKYGLYYP